MVRDTDMVLLVKNSVTVGFCNKFAARSLLYFPLYLKTSTFYNSLIVIAGVSKFELDIRESWGDDYWHILL